MDENDLAAGVSFPAAIFKTFYRGRPNLKRELRVSSVKYALGFPIDDAPSSPLPRRDIQKVLRMHSASEAQVLALEFWKYLAEF